MKIHKLEQGSPAWLKFRLGMPTASEFKKILTPKGKLSDQAKDYAYQLIAESITQEPVKDLDNLYWVERGKMMEPEAVKLYEFQYDLQTESIGMITNDAVTIGCSPDRVIKGRGLLEIKSPSPQTHIKYMTEGFDPNYHAQTQGQLWLSEVEVNEWFSYHPILPPVRIVLGRDEEYIKALSDAVNEFVYMKDKMLAAVLGKIEMEQQAAE